MNDDSCESVESNEKYEKSDGVDIRDNGRYKEKISNNGINKINSVGPDAKTELESITVECNYTKGRSQGCKSSINRIKARCFRLFAVIIRSANVLVMQH